MEKRKEYFIIIIKLLVFCIIFELLLSGFTYVLRDKKAAEEIITFKNERENSLDILLLGPSTMATGVSPMTLWNEYGIASFNLAMGGQSIPINYYNLKIALETQDPQLVVMDIGYIFQSNKVASQPVRFRQFLDNTAFSVVKLQAVMDIVDRGEWTSHIFSIFFYHERWKGIGESDFEAVVSYDKGSGGSANIGTLKNNLTVLDKTDTTDIDKYQISVKYLLKIINLCQENDIKILFVNLPSYATGKTNHGDGEELQRIWNAFYYFAEEQGVDYINCLHELDTIGIDFSTDFFDWRHLNLSGKQKVTKFLGEYITENYDIPDHRGDADYAQWNKDYKKYINYINKKI